MKQGFNQSGFWAAWLLPASLLMGWLCLFPEPGQAGDGPQAERFRRLPLEKYTDQVKGGWFGQMVGVSFGRPYEFKHNAKPITGALKPWTPERIKLAFKEDDLYVDMTFLRVVETKGVNVSIVEAGKAFAATKYPLYFANQRARDNIRSGIMPPQSGSPRYSIHIHDIDFQIESDAIGLICPGMVEAATRLSDKFGHIMNYGEGVHGGVFVAGMLAEAFFEKDIHKVIAAGLTGVPPASGYAKLIRKTVELHGKYPQDWQKAWAELEAAHKKSGPIFCWSPIDAKINGAYIVFGLLYGGGDPLKTVELATRPGKDNDCNPASAMGVLGVMLGFEKMRQTLHPGPIPKTKFIHTPYTFEEAAQVTVKLGRQVLKEFGGREEGTGAATVLLLPQRKVTPVALEKIDLETAKKMFREGRLELAQKELKIWDPKNSWRLEGEFGRRWPPRLAGTPPDYKYYGQKPGFMMVPPDSTKPTTLVTNFEVSATDKLVLAVDAINIRRRYREKKGWNPCVVLRVIVDGRELGQYRIYAVGRQERPQWRSFSFALPPPAGAGKTMEIKIEVTSDHGDQYACVLAPVRLEPETGK